MSGRKGVQSKGASPKPAGVKSKIFILVDVDEEANTSDEIEVLKQKIRELSGNANKGLHEKAYIKLKRGRVMDRKEKANQ